MKIVLIGSVLFSNQFLRLLAVCHRCIVYEQFVRADIYLYLSCWSDGSIVRQW